MKFCALCDRTYEDNAEVCSVDGATLRRSGAKQDSLIGAVVKGRYKVLRKLGEGGMGAVYLADQFSINRKVALKILHPDYARDEDFVRRFRQEAMLAASFSHHNAVTVFDFDQADDGRLYIVMEYMDGQSLSAVIKNQLLDIGRALRLSIQIAEGLSAAHRAGIIHRDIKPENIMVMGGGEHVKLMDFGIARLRDSAATTRLTQPGMIMGTPAYMAPEQIEGGEITERTDIYALGIVLYELLTNRVPFTASTPSAILLKHLKEVPLSVRKIRNEIPASLERIVSQALQKSPAKRFARMEEVVEALKNAQRDTEQRLTAKGSSSMPGAASVRGSFSSLATPFKRLFARRSGQIDVERALRNYKEVREASISSGSSSENAPTEPLLSQTKSSEISEDCSRLSTAGETLAPEVGRSKDTRDQRLSSQRTLDTQASTETLAQTVALTHSLDDSEAAIQQNPIVDRVFKDPSASFPIEKIFPATAHPDVRSSAETFDAGKSATALARGALQSETFPPREAEQAPTMIAGLNTIASDQLKDTMAETTALTQPIRELATKKSMKMGALTATLMLLFGGAIGLVVYRSLSVETTPDGEVVDAATENSPFADRMGTPQLSDGDQENVKAPDAGQPASVPPPRSAQNPTAALERRGAAGALDAKTKEGPEADTSPPAKLATTKSDKKPLTLPEPRAAKKLHTEVSRENKPVEAARIAESDREQRLSQKSTLAPETPDTADPKTKVAALKESPAPTPASKKTYEPPAQPQIASIPKPETVTPAPPPLPRVELKNLSIVAKKRDLSVPERVVLTAKGKYSDGSETDIKGGVDWKSSDSSVASVSSRGEVQALKEGTTQISATYQGVPSGTYTFYVKGTEENPKPNDSGEQIKDIRRRLLR